MTATKYLTLFFLSFILLGSCSKEELIPVVSDTVTVVIQNATTTQPIAVRLTDECWEAINPVNTVTFTNVDAFSNTFLLAFTKDDDPSAYNRAAHQNIYNSHSGYGGCGDNYVQPPYNFTKEFSFNTEITIPDKSAPVPTVTIIAEEIDERTGSDLSGIAKVRFRVLER
jgi:hypothetical protein